MKGKLELSKRTIDVQNRRLDDDVFFEERRRILSLWPTGKDVDLDEAVARHQSLSAAKHFVTKTRKAKKEGRTLIQPRGGVGLIDEFINNCKMLEEKGRADLLPSTTDSYTRYGKYDLAEKAIKESEKAGRTMLNGTPLVNWGLPGCRRVIDSINVPIDARSCDVLAYEIALCAGYTSILASAISQLSYWPQLPPEESIRMYQQLFRLVGYYTEQGAPILVDVLPIQSVSFYVNSLEIATEVIDALLMAEQGVKHFFIRFQQNCHITQDIAKGETLREVAEGYFNRCGYKDAELHLSVDTWASPFPQDWGQASVFGVLAATVAHSTRASRLMVKSVDEGLGLPGNEAQIFSLRAAKQALIMLNGQTFPLTREVQEEKEMMKTEARAIIDKVFEMGEGDLALGAVRAIEVGVLEHPFSSNRYNTGKVLPVRDVTGAVRYLDCGNLPFSKEMIEAQRHRVEERKRLEKVESDFALLIRDSLAFARPLEEMEGLHF
jgi:methylaspartate mutase epsilon subunit